MTDQSRQINSANTKAFGLAFVHGKKGGVPISGWKNNLYGDGHVESRTPRRASWSADGTSFINPDPNPDELQPRWGNSNAPFMW
jgi:prepilin-type processing-associated H-X9-DG protein